MYAANAFLQPAALVFAAFASVKLSVMGTETTPMNSPECALAQDAGVMVESSMFSPSYFQLRQVIAAGRDPVKPPRSEVVLPVGPPNRSLVVVRSQRYQRTPLAQSDSDAVDSTSQTYAVRQSPPRNAFTAFVHCA